MKTKDTWEKTVKVNNKRIPKKKVLAYYRDLWRSSPMFRNYLRKKGAFIRATYNGKTVVKRRAIVFRNWADVERAVKEHAVEFHIPVKSLRFASYLDVDLPPPLVKDRKRISRSILKKLRTQNVNISMITDAPSGVHILSSTPKKKMVAAVKEIEARDPKRYKVGKSSPSKIVLDPNEPNVAVPGSLSYKGAPYKRWKKV
jgi:hypothetical protein